MPETATLAPDDALEITKPLVDLPCRVIANAFNEEGSYYEHLIVSIEGKIICFCPAPDPSDSTESHAISQKRVEAICKAINAGKY